MGSQIGNFILWTLEYVIRLTLALVMYTIIIGQLDVNTSSDVAGVGGALTAIIVWSKMTPTRSEDGN